ncbi:MAG: hypothetical protein Q9179_003237 [Wetmoreana sp. 5 TL-2023]
MKPGPRDRPSAIEALTHPWLQDVVEGSPEGTERPADGAMEPTHGNKGPGEEPSSSTDQTAQPSNGIAGLAGGAVGLSKREMSSEYTKTWDHGIDDVDVLDPTSNEARQSLIPLEENHQEWHVALTRLDEVENLTSLLGSG